MTGKPAEAPEIKKWFPKLGREVATDVVNILSSGGWSESSRSTPPETGQVFIVFENGDRRLSISINPASEPGIANVSASLCSEGKGPKAGDPDVQESGSAGYLRGRLESAFNAAGIIRSGGMTGKRSDAHKAKVVKRAMLDLMEKEAVREAVFVLEAGRHVGGPAGFQTFQRYQKRFEEEREAPKEPPKKEDPKDKAKKRFDEYRDEHPKSEMSFGDFFKRIFKKSNATAARATERNRTMRREAHALLRMAEGMIVDGVDGVDEKDLKFSQKLRGLRKILPAIAQKRTKRLSAFGIGVIKPTSTVEDLVDALRKVSAEI